MRGANPLHLAIANGRSAELLGTFLSERPSLAAHADASGRCPLEYALGESLLLDVKCTADILCESCSQLDSLPLMTLY